MTTNPASADCRMMRSASYFLVDDVFATAEFYRDVLGFTFDEFFGVPPSFVMVQRDDVSIMFQSRGPIEPSWTKRLMPMSTSRMWINLPRSCARRSRYCRRTG
jgi:hypothetical protein